MAILERLLSAALLGLTACSIQPGELTGLHEKVGQSESSPFCDARAVIAAKCVRCHGDPPENGAPFSLATYADVIAPAPSSKHPERTRADRMLAAVETDLMPFTSLLLEPPVEPLTCEEKATLLAWLRAGAPLPPSGDESCTDAPPALLACDE
jgi:uncharacterized membrane protein